MPPPPRFLLGAREGNQSAVRFQIKPGKNRMRMRRDFLCFPHPPAEKASLFFGREIVPCTGGAERPIYPRIVIKKTPRTANLTVSP